MQCLTCGVGLPARLCSPALLHPAGSIDPPGANPTELLCSAVAAVVCSTQVLDDYYDSVELEAGVAAETQVEHAAGGDVGAGTSAAAAAVPPVGEAAAAVAPEIAPA